MREILTPQPLLVDKLKKVGEVFDIQEVLDLPTGKDDVSKYYRSNKFAYSLFHTFSNRMHMGISRDGVYKEEDLFVAENFIDTYVKALGAKNVLELATGRGATSSFLAEQNRQVRFDGIDLSEVQLRFARKKAKKLDNYFPVEGDYHDLSRYPRGKFDIAFEIEAVCHSIQKETVLDEVREVLRPKGIFILINGYSNKQLQKQETEEIATKLVEKSMAVAEFEDYGQFLKKADKAGFVVEHQEDVSEFIMPTLHRFERLAEKFFNHPKLGKLAVSAGLSKTFAYNAIAGYLMPDIFKGKMAQYYMTVLRKK